MPRHVDYQYIKLCLLGNRLPGARAHEPLRAKPIGQEVPRFNHSIPPRKGSVLLLLCPESDNFRFPLIKRPEYAGMHSGQISLPGGKAEPGETPVQTALREANEEIGVDPGAVKVVGCLSDFYVIPSNILVTPVVGILSSRQVFRPDKQEVVRIIEGRLSELLRDDAVKEKEIEVAGRYRMWAPHFEIEGEVVWGATAMMLNEFRVLLRESLAN
ncbi:MAG: coenzyme A pyrophosphatase [Cyclobacteriaceae bacterium]|nr:MAG: coenzyme A pyrophosphatase [Cyclobacteriaceae bacterium]